MQLTTKISTNTSLVGGAIALAKCARVSCACRSDHRHIGPHLPFAAADNCNINIKVNNYNNLVSYNLVKIQLHFTSSTAMNLAEISLPVNRLRHRERDNKIASCAYQLHPHEDDAHRSCMHRTRCRGGRRNFFRTM